jgi:hypothetical protein
MKTLLKSMSLCVVGSVLVSCSDSAEGVWHGECLNESVGTKSGMKMTIKQEGDKLQGILMLQDELYGSGRLTGYVTGKDVTMHSEGNMQTFINIVWSGKLKGDTIKGTYRVEPAPSAEMLGREVQKGTFIIHRD